MSWLSEGFSSLTGQITTFTKDVISEATEEVEDPVTELQVAKKKIEDFESENSQLKLEYERLKRRNEELSERADTAEFQVGTISQEYRKLLQQKEDEVKNLREEIKGQQRKLVTLASSNSLKDMDSQQGDKNLLTVSSSTPRPSMTVAVREKGAERAEGLEWMEGWGEDVVDMGLHGLEPESQGDISQLQSDLVRLQVECQHWKELAQQRNVTQVDVVSADKAERQDEIETLKRQLLSLQQESMQHHHELAAIQSLHAQQLESLALRHQQELLRAQEEFTDGGSSQEYSQGMGSLEQQNGGERNEMLLAMNHKLQYENQILKEKLAGNEVASQELRQAVNALREQLLVNESGNVRHLQSESSLITSCVQDIQSAIHVYQTNIHTLQHQQNVSQEEAKSLQSQVDSLSNEIGNKQQEILSLQEALFQLKESPRKSVSSGSSQECEEEELSELREELHRKQVQKERLQTHLSQVEQEHNQELAELNASKQELSSELSSLRIELNTSVQSANQAIGQAEFLQKENKQLSDELKQLQNKLSAAELDRTMAQNAVEIELQRLHQEKAQLSHSLELDRNSLACEQKELQRIKLALDKKEQELDMVHRSIDTMEKKLKERDREMVDLHKQLEERDVRMHQLKQEHNQLVADHATKCASLSEHQELLADAVHVREELEGKVSTLQDQISELRQQQVGKVKGSREWEEQHLVEQPQMEASHKPTESETVASSPAHEMELTKQSNPQLSAENQRLKEELGKVEKQLEKEMQEKKQLHSQLRDNDKLRREADSRVEMMVMEGDIYQQELRRLREHLLKVEDQHTQELLQADDTENQLRQELRTIQEELMAVTTSHSEHNLQMQQKVAYLEEQVRLATTEKDHVLSELLHAQEEAEQSKTAVHNLQTVLEQFQQEKASEVSQALQQTRNELAQVHDECQRLRELHSASQEEELGGEGKKSVLDLRQEIIYKDQRITELTEELERFRDTLNRSRVTIEHLSSEEDNKVDRQLVKNLFLGFLSSQDGKKMDVVKLIGKILEFSPQEFDQASANVTERGRGWMSGWLGRKPAHSPSTQEQPSFSQLFISFLETESVPSTPVALSHPPSKPSSSSRSHPQLPSHLQAAGPSLSSSLTSAPLPSVTTPARPVMLAVPPTTKTAASSEQSSSGQHLQDLLNSNDH